jgi:hypothetical protein
VPGPAATSPQSEDACSTDNQEAGEDAWLHMCLPNDWPQAVCLVLLCGGGSLAEVGATVVLHAGVFCSH